MGTVHYRVQRRLTDDPDVNASYEDLGTSTSNVFVDLEELKNGESYTYRVRTEQAGSEGGGVHSGWALSAPFTAVNCPAVANRDPNADGAYQATEEENFAIAAPGVLANDIDVDSPTTSLQTVVVTLPTPTSAFALQTTGAFNVTFTDAGSKTFTYKVVNPLSADSNVETVAFDVQLQAPTNVVATLFGDPGCAGPQFVEGESQRHRIQLDWTSKTGGGRVFRVERRLTSAPDVDASYVLAGTSTTNGFVDPQELKNAESYTYRVRSQKEGAVSSEWALSNAITAVNCPAVANRDPNAEGAYQATQNVNFSVPPSVPNLLDNDTDVDSPKASLQTVVVTPPTATSAFTLNPNGSFNVTFTETGPNSFTYKVVNPLSADSNVAIVAFNVQAQSEPLALATVRVGLENSADQNTRYLNQEPAIVRRRDSGVMEQK